MQQSFAQEHEQLDASKALFILNRENGNLHLLSSLNGKTISSCQLNIDDPINNPFLTSDKTSLIIGEHSYILISDIAKCDGTAIEVFDVPKASGLLADINTKKSLYISVDLASVQPMLYLATVARIGSTKPLVNLPGSYNPGKSPEELSRSAFNYDELKPARISMDGRYVAPSGEIDCTADAYPGVWDLDTKKKVSLDDSKKGRSWVINSCNRLFSSDVIATPQ